MICAILFLSVSFGTWCFIKFLNGGKIFSCFFPSLCFCLFWWLISGKFHDGFCVIGARDYRNHLIS